MLSSIHNTKLGGRMRGFSDLRWGRLRAALIAASLLVCLTANAMAAGVVFEIAAGEAATTLKQFAAQAHVQLLFDYKAVQSLKTPAVKGQLEPTEALKILLRGTGLTFRRVNDRTFAVMALGTEATGAVPTNEASGSAADREEKKGSSEGFRMAQVDQGASKGGSSPGGQTSSSRESSKKPLELQEVTVTARRREENINSVPVAITALTGAELRSKSIETAQDLQNYIPSLNVSSSGPTRDDYIFALRGMAPTGGSGPGAVLAGGGTGVVAYFADVPTTAAGPGLFYDLENVQVAEGPQGTLFGKNTTGGVVLFVPRKPGNDFGGSVEIGGGNYNMKTSTAVVNVPVVEDKLLIRFAAQVLKRDGFTVDRGPFFPGKDYDNRDYWAARLSVVLRPTDDLENYTIFSAFHSDGHGDGFVLTAVNPSGPFASQLLPIFAQQQAAGIRSTALSDNEIDRRYNYGVINTTRWSLSDSIQFKNIFSYQVQKWRNGEDIDGTYLVLDDLVAPRSGAWHTQVGTYTEEPQFQGTALSSNIKYTLGAYYEDGHNTAPQPYEVDVALGNFIIQQANQTNSERSRGLYGQTTYDFGGVSTGLKGLKLTVGYRYTWDDYEYGISAYSPSIGNTCLTSPGTYPQSGCFFDSSGKSTGSSWTLGLDYQVREGTLLYIRSGRGYVPGGFNPSFGFTPGGVNTPQFRFAPESVIDVELGVKSEFAVGSAPAQINADIFHSDFTNIQRLVSETLPGGVQSNFTTNASEAEIEGVEFQGSIVPVKNLRITATYSYNYGKYTKIDPAAAPSLVGIPFAYLPANKLSVSTSYTLPLDAAFGELSLGAFYSYQSKFFDAPAVQPFDHISGYGLLNARLDWNGVIRSPLDASFFLTNATDKRYRVGQYSNYYSDGRITSFYGEPRMFGVQLRYRFGR